MFGAILALASGLFVVLMPKGSEYPAGEFAWNFCPYLVELAFWLGMFAGMHRGASQRIGMALALTQPWKEPLGDRESTGRFFGRGRHFLPCWAFLSGWPIRSRWQQA